jgi:hypothetical protein
MTITELTDRLKTVKVKDTEILFRNSDGTTFNISGMFYGVKGAENTVAHPQVGEEPNCVIVSMTEL